MNIGLAHIRNKLLNEDNDDEYIRILKEISDSLVESANPFFKICKQALTNAIEDIKNGNLTDAAYQVNLIHNMPLDKNGMSKWNENHFYEFEVPVYFENTNNVDRIKKMILILADLIGYTSRLLKTPVP